MSTNLLSSFEMVMVGVALYALPTIIAICRRRNVLPVILLNFCPLLSLGAWSLVGWAFAMFLAWRPLPEGHPDLEPPIDPLSRLPLRPEAPSIRREPRLFPEPRR